MKLSGQAITYKAYEKKVHRLHRFTLIIRKNKKNPSNLCNLWTILIADCHDDWYLQLVGQFYSGSEIFGQYVSRIFFEINMEVNRN